MRKFEINGQTYEMNHGTFRNNISKLRKAGVVELTFRSKPAYYTIPATILGIMIFSIPIGIVLV
jgi:hypothetical protein